MSSSALIVSRLTDLTVDVLLTSVARGDFLYRGASKWNNKAVGTVGQVMKVVDVGSGVLEPGWATVIAGDAFLGNVQSFTASQTVVASGAAAIPLTVKGAASQTAKFLRVRDSVDGDIGGFYPTNSGAGIGLSLQWSSVGDRGVTIATDASSILNVVTSLGAGMLLDGVRFAGNGTTLCYTDSAYANSAANTAGNTQLGCITVGRDHEQAFSIVHGARLSDTAPRKTIIAGENAYQSAVTNLSGESVYLIPGFNKAGSAGTNGRVYLGWDGTSNNGHAVIAGDNAAIADSGLQAGHLNIWLDDTDGACKVKFKAKQADGTVRMGEVALT